MKEYPTEVDVIDLRQWGKINFVQWLHNGRLGFSEDGITQLSKHIPAGSLAIDIGAYTGDTAIPMALCVGRSGKVIAFEPGPAAYPLLCENVNRNPRLNIDPVEYAITAVAGEYSFHYCDEAYINGGFSLATQAGPEGCGNPYETKVKGVHLTDFLNANYSDWVDKLSYVKIDAEGYDKEILKANADFLYKHKPVVEVEVYPFLTDEERTELMGAIRNIGYHWDCPDSQFWLPKPSVANVICLPN